MLLVLSPAHWHCQYVLVYFNLWQLQRAVYRVHCTAIFGQPSVVVKAVHELSDIVHKDTGCDN